MNRDAWKRYGAEGSWFYDIVCPGFKYNLTDMQASLGLHQLRKLRGFHDRRRAIVEHYNMGFSELEQVQVPVEHSHVEHAWHLYVLRLNLDRLAINRNQFMARLRDCNIGSSVHFIPIHLHRYYQEKYGYKPEDFPIAYREYQRMVSLPLSPRMTDDDVAEVIEAVISVSQSHRATQTGKRLPDCAVMGGTRG